MLNKCQWKTRLGRRPQKQMSMDFLIVVDGIFQPTTHQTIVFMKFKCQYDNYRACDTCWFTNTYTHKSVDTLDVFTHQHVNTCNACRQSVSNAITRLTRSSPRVDQDRILVLIMGWIVSGEQTLLIKLERICPTQRVVTFSTRVTYTMLFLNTSKVNTYLPL